MANSVNSKKTLLLVFLLLLGFVSLTELSAQDTEKNDKEKKPVSFDLILENIDISLNSENHGVRMSAVELVGRYNISSFEERLVEMLEEEDSNKDRLFIALNLYKLGSLSSINVLKDTQQNCDNAELKEFCEKLLEQYNRYEKIRSEYFENSVVALYQYE